MQLKSLADAAALTGMARFGINTQHALGVSMPALRKLAGKTHDHALAEQLWQTGIHESRILAAIVDVPAQVTPEQMERWVVDFDSWDVCDQVTTDLFDLTPFAHQKALEWAERGEEYVKRAGFALMAGLAVHNKTAPDVYFMEFFPAIERQATDGRNFVKKAVNWALRNIGKRNPTLRQAAIQTARNIQAISSPAARWIAADALRELSKKEEKSGVSIHA